MGSRIDHEQRRAEFAAAPGFSGRVLCTALAAMFDDDPKTASYDLIFDVRGSDTGIQIDDLDIVSQAYQRHARETGPKYSCFISTDPNYHLLVTTMNHLFPDRTNRVFVAPESARRYLDEVRAKAG